MGGQATELLKGTLEGIVLAILDGRPAYGYEITEELRARGFTDMADGTVYALLIRIERRGLVVAVALASLGVVMVASSSIWPW